MIKYTKEEKSIIWLDSFVGLEYKIKLQILNECQNFCEITQNLPKFSQIITKYAGSGVYNNMQAAANDSYLNQILSELYHRQAVAVTYKSPLYPKELLHTAAYPIVLYCKGNLQLLKGDKFAIVGSRRTSPQIMRLTSDISADLSGHFTIVSGLAEGGDTAAIKGALKSGKVISVLAYGFDYAYPEENRALLSEIYQNALAISEHPPETAPKAYLFPVRNRIIAGLSKGVLIVSGGETSGTWHTGNYAVDYSRDLFALPYSCGIRNGKVCNYFIKNGGELCESAEDILNFYGIESDKNDIAQDLTESEQSVKNALLEQSLHINQLILKTGLKIHELLPVLSALEIKNIIEKTAANMYAVKG